MRTVVIGGGLAGLSAAIQLAADGDEVLLVESRKSLGGCVRIRESREWVLDPGLHLLHRRGAFYQFLRKLRAPRVLGPKWRSDDFFTIGQTRDSGLSALTEMRPYSKLKPPREFVIPYGGWTGLVGRLVAAANQLGVVYEIESTVESINLQKGRVISVTVEGNTIECDYIVIAASPFDTVRLLENAGLNVSDLESCTPHMVAALDVAIEGKMMRPYSGFYEPISGIIAIDVSSEGRIPENRHSDECAIIHAVHLKKDGEEALEEIKNFLDSRCSGWRKLSTLRRSTASILLHPCELEQRVDGALYIDNGIVLAGAHVISESVLSDAAIETGRAAAKLLKNHR
jgi:2-polyprenyl-6-methoxyphenol hydroxylase-like FAD-dependent oxidoreductase